MRLSKLALAAVVAAAPLPAFAHHGWAGQDNEHVTTLTGTVQAVRYQNPHSELNLVGADGKRWLVTLAPLGRMTSRGVGEGSIKVGDKVSIDGHRNLNPDYFEMKADNITFGGKTIDIR